MLEIPEVIVLTKQLNDTISGKKIKKAVAGSSPHKFAWFFDDPAKYHDKLCGKTIGQSFAYAGRLEIEVEDVILNFGEGVNLRFYDKGEKLPSKHQLCVEFEDDSTLIGTIAMYGGIWCCKPNEIKDDLYYKIAKESISPLSSKFDYTYFQTLFSDKTLKMSAKAFLATEQRIPGLGNGVLQDILLNARIHPKKKMNTLTENQKNDMFNSIKYTLNEMVGGGGRDTERDLFGNQGKYITKLSKNTVSTPCVNCGSEIKKETYMGGSIYYCDGCQER